MLICLINKSKRRKIYTREHISPGLVIRSPRAFVDPHKSAKRAPPRLIVIINFFLLRQSRTWFIRAPPSARVWGSKTFRRLDNGLRPGPSNKHIVTARACFDRLVSPHIIRSHQSFSDREQRKHVTLNYEKKKQKRTRALCSLSGNGWAARIFLHKTLTWDVYAIPAECCELQFVKETIKKCESSRWGMRWCSDEVSG